MVLVHRDINTLIQVDRVKRSRGRLLIKGMEVSC
jgi:hypothetical protein